MHTYNGATFGRSFDFSVQHRANESNAIRETTRRG